MAEFNRGVSNQPFPGAGPGVEECWVEIDGARMRYLRAGSGPPLILLHGLLGYSFSWRFNLPALAPCVTAYAPDLLGAGFSDRPRGIDHSMDGEARRILQFANRLGLSSFDLLGTSHGGAVAMFAVAQSLADATKPQVRRLILVAPVNPFSPHGRHLARLVGSDLGSACFRALIPQVRFMYPYWHRRMYGDRRHIPDDAFGGYMEALAMPDSYDHALSIVRSWTADLCDLEAILPKMGNIPTLFLWGSKDPAVYAASARPLARFFPNSRSKVFLGIGHLPYEECPDEFNRTLIEFLNASGS